MELTSDWPPERKTTPATSAGTWSRKTRTVAAATSSGPACVEASAPDSTMFTLRSEPARSTRCAASCSYSASSVRAVAAAHASIEWSPSIRISGSTIGTMSASWQSAA